MRAEDAGATLSLHSYSHPFGRYRATVASLQAELDKATASIRGYQDLCDEFYASDACAQANRIATLEAQLALRDAVVEAARFCLEHGQIMNNGDRVADAIAALGASENPRGATP